MVRERIREEMKETSYSNERVRNNYVNIINFLKQSTN